MSGEVPEDLKPLSGAELLEAQWKRTLTQLESANVDNRSIFQVRLLELAETDPQKRPLAVRIVTEWLVHVLTECADRARAIVDAINPESSFYRGPISALTNHVQRDLRQAVSVVMRYAGKGALGSEVSEVFPTVEGTFHWACSWTLGPQNAEDAAKRFSDAADLLRRAIDIDQDATRKRSRPDRKPDLKMVPLVDVCKRLCFSSRSYRKGVMEHHDAGIIWAEEVERPGHNLWNVWIVQPEKLPPSGE